MRKAKVNPVRALSRLAMPSSCRRCGGLMHEEWTKPTPLDRRVRLLACFICGDRIDEQIQLQRLFAAPQREPTLLVWEQIRRQVSLARERGGLV